MAGGKSERIKIKEKHLAKIRGKPMIQRVIEAVSKSRYVNDVYVAVTKNTPRTLKWLKRNKIDFVVTSGRGYEFDVVEALKARGVPALVVVADLPLISTEAVDNFLRESLSLDYDIITLAVPAQQYLLYGSPRSLNVVKVNNLAAQPIGLSVFKKIECETWTTILTEMKFEFINVNTVKELSLVKRVVES